MIFVRKELELIPREKAKANGGGQPQQRFCDCLEILLDGKRLPCPPHHDCQYVRQRSELVPVAVALTNASVPDDSARWTRVFNTEMERLARPLLK
jgi:hypothetical protein